MSKPKISPKVPYFDLGSFSRKIGTSSPDAQIWFNRGLNWAYGFNHDEAVFCFEQVVAHDPSALMGYWGIAYSAGPHYNKPWAAFDKDDLAISYRKGIDALKMAKEISAGGRPTIENALLTALEARYPPEPELKLLEASNHSYAVGMRNVYQECIIDDLDVLVLTIDALMNTAPWLLFEARTGKPNLKTPVLEIGELLEKGMKHSEANDHPGLLHLYIHWIEMSTTPEKALVPGDRLRYLVPDSGHLQHMPSHIYVLIGDYRQAIDANLKAMYADDKYWAIHPTVGFYTIYRLHNIDSLIYAAMLAGQSKVALLGCDRLEAALPESILRVESPPMADWTEVAHASRMHVLIRFGMWDTIKNTPLPADQTLYCSTTAFIYYAKGIAHAATGNIAQAEEFYTLFQSASDRVPLSRLDFPNTVRSELAIANEMLLGELAYRRGNFDTAFAHLEKAVKLDDGLMYSEPWGWQLPTRHAYAALLLEQGRVEDAARAYAQDLGLEDGLVSAHQHPNNVWALKGYYDCLIRLGRKDEAVVIKQQLVVALAVADVKIGASCFCSAAANGTAGADIGTTCRKGS